MFTILKKQLYIIIEYFEFIQIINIFFIKLIEVDL
jgi:hypothetical protein